MAFELHGVVMNFKLESLFSALPASLPSRCTCQDPQSCRVRLSILGLVSGTPELGDLLFVDAVPPRLAWLGVAFISSQKNDLTCTVKKEK